MPQPPTERVPSWRPRAENRAQLRRRLFEVPEDQEGEEGVRPMEEGLARAPRAPVVVRPTYSSAPKREPRPQTAPSSFTLDLSSQKRLKLSLFNGHLWAHVFDNKSHKSLSFSPSEFYTLLDNANNLEDQALVLASNAVARDMHHPQN